jgi:hypothetical protein
MTINGRAKRKTARWLAIASSSGPSQLTQSGSAGSVLFKKFDGITDGLNFFGRIVGNFAPELFLKGHDQLDGVEAVGTEVIDEAGAGDDFFGFDPQLVDHDFLHAAFDVAHFSPQEARRLDADQFYDADSIYNTSLIGAVDSPQVQQSQPVADTAISRTPLAFAKAATAPAST